MYMYVFEVDGSNTTNMDVPLSHASTSTPINPTHTQVGKAPASEYAGIPVSLGARVVLAPSYALSFRCMRVCVCVLRR